MMLMLIVLTAVTAAFGAVPAADAPATPGQQLVAQVAAFRDEVRIAPEAAFVRYAGDKGQALFGPLGRKLCPTSDPSPGWAYFFETSITSLVLLTDKTALSLYYHPYSDTALVVEWTRSKAGSAISDAELMMGDTLRRQGKPPYDIEPHWLRRSIPPYMAASLSAAQTVREFQRIFAVNNKPFKGKWRAALTDAKLLASSHLGAGVMFESNLTYLARYLNAADLEPLRAQSEQILAQLRHGNAAEVLAAAPGTRPESRDPLTQYAAQWGQARVITYIVRKEDDRKHHFVLFSVAGRSEYLMSFYYCQDAPDGTPALRRIDLIDHNQTFNNVDAISAALKAL